MEQFLNPDLISIARGVVANLHKSSILIFDKELRFVFAGGEELEKVNYNAADMIGKLLKEVIPPESLTYLEPHYHRALNKEKFQIKLVRGNITYLTSFSYLEFGKASTLYGMAVTQNISDLVSAEEQLKQQKELYENVVQGISAGVWHWPDVNSQQEWWSERYYELLGYKTNEIEATLDNFAQLIHPDDRQAAFDVQKKHFVNDSTFYIEYRLQTKHKGYRWFLATGKALLDENGQPKSMVGSIIDIDDRKIAEDLLINATLKFRGIFNNISGYMALLTPDGKYVECSPSILALRQLNLHDVLGKYFWDIGDSEIDKQGGKKLKEFVERAVNGELSREDTMFSSTRWGIKYLTIMCKPIYDTNRKITYIIAEGHDITDVTEAKNILDYQKQQLENFAYITSHNLRAPAANIKMLVNLINEDNDEGDKNLYLNKIFQSSDVLMETIDTLAEILKIRQNENLTKHTNQLQNVVDKVKAELSASIRDGGATVEADFSKCEVVQFPRAYLESIFMNLVSNSIKYASPDRKPHIIIKSDIVNDRPTLTFSDNGIGIDLKRYGAKIFGLYKVFTKHKDAHGVGLFLVKNQVETQGGTIIVQSEVDKGCLFTITF